MRIVDFISFVETWDSWLKDLQLFSEKVRGKDLSGTDIWKLQLYIRGLFKMSPLQVGDKAEIVVDLGIKESSGWWCYRHDLVKGAVGMVVELDYIERGFTCLFKPDIATWTDSRGVRHEVEEERKPCFFLKVDNLKRVD